MPVRVHRRCCSAAVGLRHDTPARISVQPGLGAVFIHHNRFINAGPVHHTAHESACPIILANQRLPIVDKLRGAALAANTLRQAPKRIIGEREGRGQLSIVFPEFGQDAAKRICARDHLSKIAPIFYHTSSDNCYKT
jgi:hypothetical protein